MSDAFDEEKARANEEEFFKTVEYLLDHHESEKVIKENDV
jgi:hypothetical protein